MNDQADAFREPDRHSRVRLVNQKGVSTRGQFVLYWMVAFRRPASNFALDRAIQWASTLGLPLIIFEPLRCDYQWASDRLHRFVIDGMAANQQEFAAHPATYYPYVEPAIGDGKALLPRLASRAAVVVTDDYPCFFIPRMVARAGERLDVRLEAVDSNGIIPLAHADRAYTAAVHFRRFVQKQLRDAFRLWPSAEPFADVSLPRLDVPDEVSERWPAASDELLSGASGSLETLPIDHTVRAVSLRGGCRFARRALATFVEHGLAKYHEGHSHPDDRGTSRLSPYLHFGHISAHEVLAAVLRREKWSVRKLGQKASGQREGWWGAGPGAEAFLDQLVVWRELAFNTATQRSADYQRYESLPEWSRRTLAEHASDERPFIYSRAELEGARTHDPVWNAAMREMLRDGWFHNYMRMLWGKKILEWSETPREAVETMIELMNRWSLDGRDPNSYAGYFWTLGRYDRPWPERPVFGTVRSMSSTNTVKKVRAKQYLREFS
jgi:deoxyribodipyrimidine photo-lyase